MQVTSIRGNVAGSSVLSDLFSRPWFTRMWTIQELALSSKATIICGQSEIEWEDLFNGVYFMSHLEQTFSGSNSNESQFASSLKIYGQLRSLIHEVGYTLSDTKISHILTLVHPYNCSYPHDKMYALCGYLTKLGVEELPPVSYNLPPAKVYAEFTKKAMLWDNSLDLLYALGTPRTLADLPSWSPDWGSFRNHMPILNRPFLASKNSEVRGILFTDNNEALHLPGLIIDTIKARPNTNIPANVEGDSARKHEIFLPNMEQRVKAWQESVDLAAMLDHYPTGQEWTVILYEVFLQGGFIGDSGQVLSKNMGQFNEWLQLLQAYNAGKGTAATNTLITEAVKQALRSPQLSQTYFSEGLIAAPKVMRSRAWNILIAMSVRDGTKHIHHWIHNMTMGKVMFSTERGYLGVGSDLLQGGDQIILIPGLRLPMIIRECGNMKYRFVAPAYVHGIMRGEEWPEEEDNVLSNFEFR